MSSMYHRQTATFIATFVQNMPEMTGELMQWWIENPLEVQAVLAGFSKKPSPNLDVWKTITLGTDLNTADEFCKAIEDCGMKVSDWTNNILGKPEFAAATVKTEVDLVRVTVAELGFKKGARRDQIYERAQELGLQLCPPEVGPQLRLQYKDQPNNEWLLIGMESIRDSDGYLRVFSVERGDSALWLGSDCDHPDDVWIPENQWLFVRPRK